MESHEPPDGVVDLPRAGIPADHGLASLGLVMQLAARTSSALAALAASIVFFEPRAHRHAGWLLFALALCIVRSQLHRIAGRDLLYGRRSLDGEVADPFGATRAYAAFGLVQAIAIGLIAAAELGTTSTTAAGLTAALALWPAALATVVLLPRFGPLRAGIPLGEDRGLEGASVVITIIAACGVLSTSVVIVASGSFPGQKLQHGWSAMLAFVFVLLLVRSCWHLRAGLAGLREASFDRPDQLASSYARWGVVSASVIGGVLALLAMSERLAPEALASIVAVCWLLSSWPLIVKRFFNHRQFAELFAGDRMRHRRAPDAGLTGLGWLLLGHAVLVSAVLVLRLTASHAGAGRVLEALLRLSGPLVGTRPAELALSAAVIGLEIITAAALLRMSDHRRAIATIYALVGGGAALAMAFTLFRTLGHHIDLRMARLIPMACQLVFPAATLLLVHRAIVPAARARYRR